MRLERWRRVPQLAQHETFELQQTLKSKPEAEHQRLGNALLRQGRLDEAAASYAQALKINPRSHEVVNSIGTLLRQAGRLEQAVVCFRKAIALEKSYAEAHCNLGLALDELGRREEAIASCTEAVHWKPDLAIAHCNLGGMLRARGDLEQAVVSCRKAIALQPDMAGAHLNLGNAYVAQGRLTDAVRSYGEAIAHSPDDPADAYNNLGEALISRGRVQDAVAAFEQAIAARPGFTGAYSNLLNLHAFTRDISPQAECVLARGWEKCALTASERAAARARAPLSAGVFAARGKGEKLRVGIVSAELGSHAVAQFLEPVLAELDRSRFHLTLFPTQGRHDAWAQNFRELADGYIPLIAMPDAQAADRVRAEHVDVLIDTTGHTFGGRLGICAHRAAPVQCTYIGYWSTTGLTEMDWFFGDPYCDPSIDTHFTERVWRLPRTAVAYRGETALSESAWKPDPAGTVWVGSLSRYRKIREETLRLWAKVLHALPEAKLLLEDGAEREGETHRRILGVLAREGIGAERVEFIPFMPGHERHMRLYDRLDVALDTIPFNGGTTAYDALWMGVPLVTLERNWIGGKMGGSALRDFGRGEWVARTEEEYVAITRKLARDVEGRKTMRAEQRAEMAASPLCDAKAMARALEEAFVGMYARWVAV